MFNHSSRPNIDYRVDVDQLVISFSASRDIEQGVRQARDVASVASWTCQVYPVAHRYWMFWVELQINTPRETPGRMP